MAKSKAVQDIDAYNTARKAMAGQVYAEHTGERTIAGMTETVRYLTRVSPDGKWVEVRQKEYAPTFSIRAWPITPQKMDAVARKLAPGARVQDDRIIRGTGTFYTHVRTYRVQD